MSQEQGQSMGESNNLPEVSSTPFESTSQEVSELIDDLDHPIKYLFKDVYEKINDVNTELDSVFEIRDSTIRRKAVETIFLLSTMLSVAGCKSSSYKSPDIEKEDDKDAPMSEQYNRESEEKDPESYTDDGSTPVHTPSVSPTIPPTPTQTKEPTPTPTLEPTETPIVHGEIEIFTEDMEEGDVLSTVMRLQSIVNSYNPENGTFQEYISQQKDLIEDEKISVALEELSQIEELDSIKFAMVLQRSIPDLDIVPFSPWPENMYEVLPEVYYNILSDPEKYPYKPNNATTSPFSEEENIWTFFGDITGYLDTLTPGDLMVNGDTFDINKTEGFQLYPVLGVKKHSEQIYLLLTTVNDDGKMELIVVSETEAKDILGRERWIYWGRSKL